MDHRQFELLMSALNVIIEQQDAIREQLTPQRKKETTKVEKDYLED